jgi:benzoyl-CoA reductase/2-hydroxyglutaryl-CoA dehydratase subunit BcrC/BadD/HgdB
VEDRLRELANLKAAGKKIVGYLPGSYVPEEIIYASGAIPVCVGMGGDGAPVQASSSVIPRNFCSFVRAQVGDKLLGRNPYLESLDLLVAPVACQHLKKLAEIWEHDADVPMVKLGVPLANRGAPDLVYFASQLEKLKARLRDLTGQAADDESLRRAIDVYNGLRESLRKVSLLRRTPGAGLTSSEFLRLNHASFYLDPVVMTGIAESLHRNLLNQAEPAAKKGPRLLLIGPNVAEGDYKVVDLVEESGGCIVIEQVDEGVRNYWQTIDSASDPTGALARAYLSERLPCAFMVESARRRLDFALSLAADFSAVAAVWYEVVGCETYDSEAYWFARQLEQRGTPVLILESDYGMSDLGALRTRVEAFVEMAKGVEF